MTLDELDRLAAEKWVHVPRYSGYEISSIGRVRSYRHKNGFRKEDVEVIKYLLLEKQFRSCDVEKLFGVNRTTIERIKNGKSRMLA